MKVITLEKTAKKEEELLLQRKYSSEIRIHAWWNDPAKGFYITLYYYIKYYGFWSIWPMSLTPPSFLKSGKGLYEWMNLVWDSANLDSALS